MSEDISCAAGCKRSVPDIEAASNEGWTHLPIQNRWRCAHCERELAEVNQPQEPQKAPE